MKGETICHHNFPLNLVGRVAALQAAYLWRCQCRQNFLKILMVYYYYLCQLETAIFAWPGLHARCQRTSFVSIVPRGKAVCDWLGP